MGTQAPLVPWHLKGLPGQTPQQNQIGVVAKGSPAPRASTLTSTSNSGSGCGLLFTRRGCKPHPNHQSQPWVGTLVSMRVKTKDSRRIYRFNGRAGGID
ncbi:hypothetical protein E2C01_071354 [Portunus trituberculatus]|uniref:Uncharacterized protein n=1 Tax=Portunus trituberculatus TaxID=210409 RepID=A0A5B7I7S2_PORTR|nr:hypothetical protein [Portunus trituberculatus]